MYGNHPYLPYLNVILMGNLRQSMTEEEWNQLGIPKESLLRIINTDNEPDLISQMLDNLPVANLDNFCDKKGIPDNIPDKNVSHPQHYGGADNPYEAIKVIESYGMDFVEGNILKYLLRYKKKNGLQDLKKAQWYLERLIKQREGK